jgi:hypothetical protein
MPETAIPTLKVKTSANKLYLRPDNMWPKSPIRVYGLLPAANGYTEDFIVELEPADNGQSRSITLPVMVDKGHFSYAGLRVRTTAMPENFGRVSIGVCRDQDPPQPPNNQRPDAATMKLERFDARTGINLDDQLMIEVDP